MTPAYLLPIFDALADRDYERLAGRIVAFADAELVRDMAARTGCRVEVSNCIDPGLCRIADARGNDNRGDGPDGRRDRPGAARGE